MFWILWTLLVIYALWPLYVFTMAMLRARLDGSVTVTAWILAFPLVISAITLDIVLNFTIFALMTWDFPRMKWDEFTVKWGKVFGIAVPVAFCLPGEYTFSQRLDRLAHGGGWRQTAARWLARTLLDSFDPTGKHIR